MRRQPILSPSAGTWFFCTNLVAAFLVLGWCSWESQSCPHELAEECLWVPITRCCPKHNRRTDQHPPSANKLNQLCTPYHAESKDYVPSTLVLGPVPEQERIQLCLIRQSSKVSRLDVFELQLAWFSQLRFAQHHRHAHITVTTHNHPRYDSQHEIIVLLALLQGAAVCYETDEASTNLHNDQTITRIPASVPNAQTLRSPENKLQSLTSTPEPLASQM